jgi:hypothetical protein
LEIGIIEDTLESSNESQQRHDQFPMVTKPIPILFNSRGRLTYIPLRPKDLGKTGFRVFFRNQGEQCISFFLDSNANFNLPELIEDYRFALQQLKEEKERQNMTVPVSATFFD